MALDISDYDLNEIAPDQIAALWQLGLLHADEFPRISMHWLELGAGTDAVAFLAGERSPTIREHGKVFDCALAEVGAIAPVSREEAYWVVVRLLLRRMIDGRSGPFPAASDLVTYVHWGEPEVRFFVRDDLPPVGGAGGRAVAFAGEELAIDGLLGLIFSLDDLENREHRTTEVARIEGLISAEASRLLERFYKEKPPRFPVLVRAA